jgi:hypothetical protein
VKKKSGKCPEYLAFVRRFPCFVCWPGLWQHALAVGYLPEEFVGFRLVQSTPTEAAHLGLSTTRRGLGQKVPDSEAGPLCADHHRLLKDSHHAGTAAFWQKHPNLDRDGLLRMLWRIFQSTI